jgi:hypothetical protein
MIRLFVANGYIVTPFDGIEIVRLGEDIATKSSQPNLYGGIDD